MAYENKNWGNIEHEPFDFEWATYLELSPLIPPVITPRQRMLYIAHLSESAEPSVKRFEIRVNQEVGHLCLSNVVEASGEEQALHTAVKSVLETLDSAGMDSHNLDFVTAHVTPDRQLFFDGQVAEGRNLKRSIRDRDYEYPDLQTIHDMFVAERAGTYQPAELSADDFIAMMADINSLPTINVH